MKAILIDSEINVIKWNGKNAREVCSFLSGSTFEIDKQECLHIKGANNYQLQKDYWAVEELPGQFIFINNYDFSRVLKIV